MKKFQSHSEVLSKHFSFSGKVVIDIGCGTGELVRWMTAQGAAVTGIDTADMIAKAGKIQKNGNERYLVGPAQRPPVESDHADLIVYIASLHHVPENEMFHALEECRRILRSEGTAIFVEPVARLCRDTGKSFESYRYRSICRMNILQKVA